MTNSSAKYDNGMENLFGRRVKILSITRGSDLAKYGNDQMRISLLCECTATGARYNITDMDMDLDYRFERLMKAFKNKEPIQFNITTDDFVREAGEQYGPQE